MTKAVKLAVVYATAIMALGLGIFQGGAAVLLGFFDASEHMLSIGVPALRIISFSFLLAGFCIVSSSAFQALGHGMLSLVVSVVRQLVVLLPAAWLLSLSGELNLVWWSFPLAELFSSALCVAFLFRLYRLEVKPMLER